MFMKSNTEPSMDANHPTLNEVNPTYGLGGVWQHTHTHTHTHTQTPYDDYSIYIYIYIYIYTSVCH